MDCKRIFSIGIVIFILFASVTLEAAKRSRKKTVKRVVIQDKKNIHHKTYVPQGYRVRPAKNKSFSNKEIVINLYAKSFSQGNAAYIEIRKSEENGAENVTVSSAVAGDRKVLLSKREWGYRGLFGIPPVGRVGKMKIQVAYLCDGVQRRIVRYINIADTKFPVYKRAMDLGKYSNAGIRLRPETIKFIQKCTAKKREAFNRISPDLLGQDFSHPRSMHKITSPFWAKRIYMRYKYKGRRKIRLKSKVRIHRGLDMRGYKGEPVYAMADGIVALAELMFYEGNFVILDHGKRIFSYYMHMNGFTVKNGDRVKAGDLIGYVGSTGISTASHLHVSFVIRGVQVNPLSVLPLPVRE